MSDEQRESLERLLRQQRQADEELAGEETTVLERVTRVYERLDEQELRTTRVQAAEA